MKSNGIKYVFIIFVIIILVFAVYKIRKDEEISDQVQMDEETQATGETAEINLGVAEFDTINPILSNNKNVQDITKIIYEPLVNLTEDYKPEACLATEWAKEDGSYLIKLRDDVKWSDGSKFTSADVQFTIDKLKEIGSIYSYNVQYVIGVDVIDDYTIRINLASDISLFEYNLTFPIMSAAYYNGEDFVNSSKNAAPVTTGKFKITDVQDSYIVLEKNENWWNSKNKIVTLQKITINKYSSIGEMYNAFKTGNIDFINTENSNLQQYIGTIGYNSKEIQGRQHGFLVFNTQNAVLSNKEVRQAIAASIDRVNAVSSVYGGYYVSSFPLEYGSWLQTNQTEYTYSTEYAEQLLSNSGWIYNARYRYWYKSINYRTQRITANILVKSSDSGKVALAENIKAQLANQGITINIVQANDAQYSAAIASKNYDIALCSMEMSVNPNLETFFGANNLANYSNDEVTTLLNEIKNTKDDNVKKEKYKRLVEIYKDDVPYVSLYANKNTIAYNSSMSGDVTPNWFNPYYNIENWAK